MQAWNLHKAFYNIQELDEQRWEDLARQCEAIDKQYINRPERKFTQNLLLSVVAELEEQAKQEGRGKE